MRIRINFELQKSVMPKLHRSRCR